MVESINDTFQSEASGEHIGPVLTPELFFVFLREKLYTKKRNDEVRSLASEFVNNLREMARQTAVTKIPDAGEESKKYVETMVLSQTLSTILENLPAKAEGQEFQRIAENALRRGGAKLIEDINTLVARYQKVEIPEIPYESADELPDEQPVIEKDELDATIMLEDLPELSLETLPELPAVDSQTLEEATGPETEVERTRWVSEIWGKIKETTSSPKTKRIIKNSAIAAGILAGLAGAQLTGVFKALKQETQYLAAAEPSTYLEERFSNDDVVPHACKKEIINSVEATKSEEYYVERKDVIEDESFIYPGSVLSTRDLAFRADRLSKEIFLKGKNIDNNTIARYENTVQLLLHAKAKYPQAVKFQLKLDGDSYSLSPLDWQDEVEVKETLSCDTLIYGGEFESVVTAIRAADMGQSVVMVYAGPLGGLNAKEGANMRYFDFVESAPSSEAQKKVMKWLGMTEGKRWSIPGDFSQKLSSLLGQYEGKIRIVPTQTYNSTHLKAENNQAKGIITGEGIEVNANNVIDVEPEGNLLDKAGVPFEIETPNMSYGLVFDIKGSADWTLRRFRDPELIHPDRIIEMAGISKDTAVGNPTLATKYKQVLTGLRRKTIDGSSHISYGYTALMDGYNLYMSCLETATNDPALKQKLVNLNKIRRCDGLNISQDSDTLSCNSVSYQGFKKAIRQNDHSIGKDEAFGDIREVEIPFLKQYLSAIAGVTLKIDMPDQFYVRQGSVAYKLKTEYKESDITGRDIQPGDLWMKYHLDIRGGEPRDGYDQSLVKVYVLQEKVGEAKWKNKPDVTFSPVDNLYLIGKNMAPPEFVGAWRIQQNLMNEGSVLIDYLSKPQEATRKNGSLSADSSQIEKAATALDGISRKKKG